MTTNNQFKNSPLFTHWTKTNEEIAIEQLQEDLDSAYEQVNGDLKASAKELQKLKREYAKAKVARPLTSINTLVAMQMKIEAYEKQIKLGIEIKKEIFGDYEPENDVEKLLNE